MVGGGGTRPAPGADTRHQPGLAGCHQRRRRRRPPRPLVGPHGDLNGSGQLGQDAHGASVDAATRTLWIVHRVSSNATLHPLNTIRQADHRPSVIDFVGKTPDLIMLSPDSHRAYVTLRGPKPAPTIPHATVGETPGIGIIDVAVAARHTAGIERRSRAIVAIALTLLVNELFYFWHYLTTGTLPENIVFLLDRILLIVIFVEVLYTVQVSFREHLLKPEPFLVVGLIAVTRRILVLTAEMSKLAKESEAAFQNAMIELALLTVLIVALVVCLRTLSHSKRNPAETS